MLAAVLEAQRRAKAGGPSQRDSRGTGQKLKGA
jgi:hypothetical protein